ncbi:PIG-L family deacetylase [Candidatus Acetothermia bacterium]|nr:PIG-L family deacetylase [Candidatus Acetothermia bacterium]
MSPPVPARALEKTVLILAPHPDDEVLAAGGAIQQHLAQGDTVHVALITSGDGQRLGVLSQRKFLDLGERRFAESLGALNFLGLKSHHVYRLGYPDRGLAKLWTDHWDSSHPFRSRYTKLDRVPYANALSPGAPYCGQSLVQDFEKLFQTLRPDRIYLPHPNDLHSDHWATHAFALYALEQLRESTHVSQQPDDENLFAYLIHYNYWPLPGGKNLHRALTPPRSMKTLDTAWLTADLKRVEVERKYRAIQFYKTQMKLIDDHLVNFARRNELFGRVPTLHLAHDSTQPLVYSEVPPHSVWSRLRQYNEIREIGWHGGDKRLVCEVQFFNTLRSQSEVRLHIKPIRKKLQNVLVSLRKGRLYLNGQLTDDRFCFTGYARSLTLQVPLEILGNARKILLGIEIHRSKKLVGRSAYRLIVLE